MLEGFRILGIFLGAFMLLSAFAPSSEPPKTTDLVFFTLFAVTGLLLIIPYKVLSWFIKPAVYSFVLGAFTLATFIAHYFVLVESGASMKSTIIILLIIYPVISCNILWYYRKKL